MTDLVRWKVSAVLLGIGLVLGYANEHSFVWVFDIRGYWWFWVIYILGAGFLWWRNRDDWQAVGATWLQVEKNWVDLYRLTEIKLGMDGYMRALSFTDADGRRIPGVQIGALQDNQAMWDLVYNGILHSIASGNCEVGRLTRRALKLPAGF